MSRAFDSGTPVSGKAQVDALSDGSDAVWRLFHPFGRKTAADVALGNAIDIPARL